MLTNRLPLIVGAFALKGLVVSHLTVEDVIAGALAVPHLIVAERQDACMGYDLLVRRERFIERKNAFDLEAFGFLAGEFDLDHLLAHLPKFLIMTEGLPKSEELSQDQQPHEQGRPKKDPQL